MFPNSSLLITGGTFSNHVHIHGAKVLDRLREASAPGALYNSAERFDTPKCHPNTRVAILNKLMQWIMGEIDTDALVMWLYGTAGAGKSAIAQKLAEVCAEKGHLLAAFFFSRTASNRNTSRLLVATLAYQVALVVPAARALIEGIIDSNPVIFDLSLETQLDQLILGPLRQLSARGIGLEGIPSFIIIDGLDECNNPDDQVQILRAFIDGVRRSGVVVRLLFASRPEQHLKMAFNTDQVQSSLCKLSLDDGYQKNDDIRLFFLDSFNDIKRTHPLSAIIPASWPSRTMLEQLVKKSSGQFIFASTVAKYVGSIHHRPMARLDVILGLPPPQNDRDLPFAELDALYTHLFSAVDDIETTLKIMGVLIILTEKLRLDVLWLWTHRIDSLLFLPPGTTLLCMNRLSSVISCGRYGGITVLHASLSDFLQDPRRSQQFHLRHNLVLTNFVRLGLRHLKEHTEDLWRDCMLHIPEGCRMAEHTPELMQDLWEYSISAEHAWCSSRENRVTFWTFFVDLLLAFEDKNLGDLYNRYLAIFNDIVLSVLHQYPSEPRVLVATLHLYYLNLWPPSDRVDLQDHAFSFEWPSLAGLDEATIDFDRHSGLSLSMSAWMSRKAGPRFLRSLVACMAKNPRHSIDSGTYATCSSRYLRYLISAASSSGEDTEDPYKEKARINIVQIAMKLLPVALSQSSTSEELVNEIGSAEFHVKYPMNGWNDDAITAVNKALETYIVRCESKHHSVRRRVRGLFGK